MNRLGLLLTCSIAVLVGCAVPGEPDEASAEAWSVRVAELGGRAVLRVISDGGGAGSGFLIHPSGLAVTNAHVVANSPGGVVESSAGLVRYEVIASGSSRDLAVLKLQAAGPLHSLRLGESAELKLGAPVLAVGAPQGMFPVVTTGVFGGRSVPGMIADLLVPEQLIHGAATLRGSSGCPILDTGGYVVGVQSAKPGQELVKAVEASDEEGRLFDRDLGRWRFQTEGFGLAVPVEDLTQFMPAWIAPEWATGLESGFTCAMSGGSVFVEDVVEGSPAFAAGLEPGDLILSISGRTVWSTVDLAVWLSEPGELQMEVQRGSLLQSFSFSRIAWQRPAWEDLQPGCRWTGGSGHYSRMPVFDSASLEEGGVVAGVKIPAECEGRDDFYVELKGWLNVPSAGRWVFELSSDDGSQLFIRDRLVVDGDGLHSTMAAVGAIELEAGLHPLRVTFFEAGGEESLTARWGLDGEELVEVPAEQIRHQGALSR